jgi:phosphoribosylformylglycinamidine (FGAM) synthase-like enzyme
MSKDITKSKKEIVYNKYNGRCAYCGIEINYNNFNIDHINPIRRDIKGKDRLNFTLEAFNIKIPKKTKPSEKVKISEKTQKIELAKDFKEATGKASKKAKENAKKEFVDRNFDNIVEKLKIQIKCPT